MQHLNFFGTMKALSVRYRPRFAEGFNRLAGSFTLVAMVSLAQPVVAATQLNNFTGEPIFDRTGKNRVKDVLVAKDQGVLYLSFEASSMAKECRFESDSAAWLQLQLTDMFGKSLGGFTNVAIATVGEEGGYRAHGDLDISEKFSAIRIDLAAGYRIRMTGQAKC